MPRCIDCAHCVPDSKYSSGYACDSRGFRTCVTDTNLYSDEPCPNAAPLRQTQKPQPHENKPLDIVSQIGLPATLEQLAEECCELGHAALKLARFLRGENPTRKNKYECQQDLEEEMGDVLLCVELIQKTGLVGSLGHIDELINGKYQRWVESLSKEGK